MSEVTQSEAILVGGSDSDRKKILDRHAAYLEANSRFDWETLQSEIWTKAPEATFFNLNGHTYNGFEQWVRLWQYYSKQLTTGEWIPYEIGGFIGSDLAVIHCHRKTKLKWVGNDPRPDEKHHADKNFVSRSTMVFRKEGDDWRVVHVHFSEASDGPRPGDI